MKPNALVIHHPAADPAHPDHENLVSKLLAALAEFGVTVGVAALTDGKVQLDPNPIENGHLIDNRKGN